MKKFKFSALWALMLALAIGFAGCSKDDNNINVDDVVEDGFYVTGEASGYTSPDNKAKLVPAKNEAADNATRAGFYEGYVYLEASKNFQIAEYVSGALSNYGGTLETVAGGVSDEPAEDYYGGNFTKDGAAFRVSTTGLYHVVVDKTLAKIVIVPVTYWSIIGDAAGGWDDSQQLLPKSGATSAKIEFEKTGVTLKQGEYKFRHTGGWKVTIDAGVPLKANTNVGGAADDLVAGGSNIALAATDVAVYTINLTWTAGSGYKFTKTKTGEAQNTDWTNVEFGLRGAAGFDGGDVDWGAGIVSLPEKDGEIYTWTITSDLVAGYEFKITDGKVWLDYNAVTWGACVADFGNAGGNISIVNSGNYTFTLKIDADNYADTKTITVVKNSGDEADYSTLVYSLIGNAFNNGTGVPASWDYDIDLTYDEVTSTPTLKNYKAENVTLIANGEFKVRKDHDWETTYGYDADKLAGDNVNFEAAPADGNIKVKANKTYSAIVFALDLEVGSWTLTFTEE
jgi:hypothetical protein